MRVAIIILALFVSAVLASNAFSVSSGKTVEFAGGSKGKVIFDGKVHADAGLKCTDCHNKIFQMKKGSTKMTMADINAGKYCGVCHNGQKAFKTNDPSNCEKCHKK